jgi:glycine hydroxymethyltransferase
MHDKPIEHLLRAEIRRQNETIDLIPSENFVSPEVLRILGSPLTNKYAEGYSGHRYYGGNEYMDEIEELAKSRARKLFKLSPTKWSVNVQPYSGSPANLAVLLALAPIGAKIMGLQLDMGGHLTHGHKVSITGKAWTPVQYGVDSRSETLDYEAILAQAVKERPAVIIAGYTAYPRKVDWKKFREIADASGAKLLVDMSHIAGLVAGKAYPSPFPYADVVMTTTHKSLRGPRSAIIFSRPEYSKAIDRAVFPGLQGGPHMNQIAAVAVALEEGMRPEFKRYAVQVVKNARALGKSLKDRGWRLVAGGTDSHLLLVDVAARGISGKEGSDLLENSRIIVNKNTIPFDKRSPMDPSGLRLGTPAITTRGMKEKEMAIIAGFIDAVLAEKKNVSKEAVALCKKFPLRYRP